jgi:hypothetical protein
MHDRTGKLLMAVILALLAPAGNAQTPTSGTPAPRSASDVPPLPHCEKPVYPEAESRAGITDVSAISFLISEFPDLSFNTDNQTLADTIAVYFDPAIELLGSQLQEGEQERRRAAR